MHAGVSDMTDGTDLRKICAAMRTQNARGTAIPNLDRKVRMNVWHPPQQMHKECIRLRGVVGVLDHY